MATMTERQARWNQDALTTIVHDERTRLRKAMLLLLAAYGPRPEDGPGGKLLPWVSLNVAITLARALWEASVKLMGRNIEDSVKQPKLIANKMGLILGTFANLPADLQIGESTPFPIDLSIKQDNLEDAPNAMQDLTTTNPRVLTADMTYRLWDNAIRLAEHLDVTNAQGLTINEVFVWALNKTAQEMADDAAAAARKAADLLKQAGKGIKDIAKEGETVFVMLAILAIVFVFAKE